MLGTIRIELGSHATAYTLSAPMFLCISSVLRWDNWKRKRRAVRLIKEWNGHCRKSICRDSSLAKRKKKMRGDVEECCGVLWNQELNGEGEHEAVTRCLFQWESSPSSGIFQRQVQRREVLLPCALCRCAVGRLPARVVKTCASLKSQDKKEMPLEGY